MNFRGGDLVFWWNYIILHSHMFIKNNLLSCKSLTYGDKSAANCERYQLTLKLSKIFFCNFTVQINFVVVVVVDLF